MSDSGNWWVGEEAVQVIGHSAAGGGVSVVFGLMEATRRLGMRPVLLATHPDVVTLAQQQGMEIWEFPGVVREPRPLTDLIVAVRLARALRARGVQVVHTHTSKGGMVGRLAARMAGCSVVLHHTHGFYHTGLRAGIGRWTMVQLERFFGRLDDIQVFINTFEFDQAVDLRIATPAQARLCFNGIEPAPPPGMSREEFCVEWGVSPDAKLVGSICRLDYFQKGLDAGLEAVRLLVSDLPEVVWIVIGDGPDRQRFEDDVSRLGLESNVRVLGRVPSAAGLHSVFDVTFAPSRREGQSVTVLEAMSCSRPVVTTDIPGNRDLVVNGATGVLVQVDDTAGMATALRRLLLDPPAREALGEAAYADFTRSFTYQAFLERAEQLYLDAFQAEPLPDPHVVEMRPAHISGAVDVHMAAFRGFFLTALGRPFMRAFYNAVLKDPSCIAYVAVDRGRVRGFVVGSGQPDGFYRRLVRRHWLVFGLAALPAVLRTPSLIPRVAQRVKRSAATSDSAGAAWLYSLGVDPSQQGQGLGALLVRRFSRTAQQRGATVVRLETDADSNEATNRFYQGLGFEVCDAYSTSEARSMLEYELDLRKVSSVRW